MDLRPFARLRVDQRRLSFVISSNSPLPWSDLAARLDSFLARLEQWLPPQLSDADWRRAVAFPLAQASEPVRQHRLFCRRSRSSPIHLDDLKNIERQKDAIVPNTRQFVQKLLGQQVLLLTGARGTGKSSLIKACLNAYVKEGLRLVEVDKDDLGDSRRYRRTAGPSGPSAS